MLCGAKSLLDPLLVNIGEKKYGQLNLDPEEMRFQTPKHATLVLQQHDMKQLQSMALPTDNVNNGSQTKVESVVNINWGLDCSVTKLDLALC